MITLDPPLDPTPTSVVSVPRRETPLDDTRETGWSARRLDPVERRAGSSWQAIPRPASRAERDAMPATARARTDSDGVAELARPSTRNRRTSARKSGVLEG